MSFPSGESFAAPQMLFVIHPSFHRAMDPSIVRSIQKYLVDLYLLVFEVDIAGIGRHQNSFRLLLVSTASSSQTSTAIRMSLPHPQQLL